MTDPLPPGPPNATPVAPPPPRRPHAPPPKARLGCLLPLVLVALFGSLLANVLFGYLLVQEFGTNFEAEPATVREKFVLGDRDAADKVAVVRIEGVISEYTMAYPVKQMEQAAKDKHVKAVVLRVDSPGGTVTASEELYQSLVNLRDNTGRRFPGSGPKPIAVSMGGVAASGGYYVAMAGSPLSAERTTITGSIGVFAALPNVHDLAEKHGVHVELIKAGDVKGSGSFFHTMAPEERQTWQDTVDGAYDTFLGVVAAGRAPLTKEQFRGEVVIDQTIPVRDEKGNPKTENGKAVTAKYVRKRADGGTFTAEQALKFKLIDKVEDLPATIRAAAAAAGLSKFKAVSYERPASVLDLLTGGQMRARQEAPDLRGLTAALTPRLWYLSPTADGAILTPAP